MYTYPMCVCACVCVGVCVCVYAQVPNKIEELCRNIRLEIDSRVQDVLDSLSKDCQALTKIVDEKVIPRVCVCV